MHVLFISASLILMLSVVAQKSESACNILVQPEGGSILLMQGGSTGKPPPNSLAIFTCEDGKKIQGASILKCLEDGYWSAPTPKCVETVCDIPLKPEHGSVLLDGSGDKPRAGSIAKFSCDNGRILEGSSTSKCVENGQWTFPTPKCRNAECDKPIKPEHGSYLPLRFDGDQPRAGSLVLFTCNDGKVLDGSPSSRCLGNGQWDFPTPKCIIDSRHVPPTSVVRIRTLTTTQRVPEEASSSNCLVPRLPHGDILEEIPCSPYFSWIFFRHIRDKAEVKVPPGKIVSPATSYILSCHNGYSFEKSIIRKKIACTDGTWIPNPACVANGLIKEGCPRAVPLSKDSDLTHMQRRVELIRSICNKYDYVWLGTLNDILMNHGILNISFNIQNVVKEGVEKGYDIEGETRTLLARGNCSMPNLLPGIAYLIFGKDGQRYMDDKGKTRYKYFLDGTSVIYLWTSIREARDKMLQRDLNYATKKLKEDGCEY